MSLSTQYIGLNAKAMNFIKQNNLSPRYPNDNHSGDNIGMFDEDILFSSYNSPNGDIYDEILQCSPWSSGPMLFTQLQLRGKGNIYCQWEEDPNCNGEVNFSNSTYYV